ncbi:MAG: hypothetical protein IH973_15250, partial [Myxococcales bacterium]|nr:hypothetical protein [Myxococcales bacterium]
MQTRAFLNSETRIVRAQTFYKGASGRSVGQILVEWQLRQDIEAAADRVPRALRDSGAIAVQKAIREDLRKQGIDPAPFPMQPKHTLRFGLMAAGLAATLYALWTFAPALLVAIGVVLGGWVIALRRHEKADPEDKPQHSADTTAHIQYASQDENNFLQNQLTHLVDKKEGWFRAFTLRGVFIALQFLATYLFNKGKLGGIPSIHFARWVFLGSRERVLFLSNFDNSWQSYLGDFVDQASNGLTAVWSNTKGYPRSKYLVSAGSKNSTSFLAWTRAHQLPTDVWYSAYPGLTVRNVNENTEIRRGLADFTAFPARDWLRVLGSVDLTNDAPAKRLAALPAPPLEVLPHDDIQGIILRGYGDMKQARYLMLKVDDPSNKVRVREAREWLSRLEIASVSGSSKKQQTQVASGGGSLVNVAFSHPGLAALGCDATLLGGFPAEFVEGSHSEARSRILGDFGDSSPKKWEWGSGSRAADVMLLIYCGDKGTAERVCADYQRRAAEHGLSFITCVEGYELKKRKEHFGFRDGIAQPNIRGGAQSEKKFNTLAAGEFLLGYGDGYRTEDSPEGANVAFAPTAADGFEFGKAGSYLVFRQLEQDVRGFWNYCSSQGRSCDPKLSAVQVASKMVGRWPNGL